MRIVITEQEKKDILSSYILIENVKQARKYVELNLLPKDILEKLISIDPSKTNKYVGWMSKIWMSEQPDLDQLRNTIEEYDVFLNKGKTKTKDINQFKTFKDLYSEVDGLNQSSEGVSNKGLESDYDTVVNNEDLLIMSPHTHEASRKLGLSHFSFRDCGNGKKDSAWCTTFKSPDHFNDYYYKNNVTFYYIKVKSPQMIEKLKESFPNRWEKMVVVALAVLSNGTIDGYNGSDLQINSKDIQTFISILNLNNIFVTRRSTGERSKNHQIAEQKKIQKYIKDGSKGDLILNSTNTLGDLTSVDGRLVLNNCNFKSLENLKSVTSLEIRNCPNLKSLNMLKYVNILVISETSIENLGVVTFAEMIDIQHCPNLESLGNIKSAKYIRIMNCLNLKSLGKLESVENLFIQNCPIKTFGELKSVGENLNIMQTPLSKKHNENEIRKMINVGGDIKL